MAETPFSPESGAGSGGTSPEDGTQVSSALTPDAVSQEPAAATSGEPSVAEPSLDAAPPAFEPAPLPSAESVAAVPAQASVVGEPAAESAPPVPAPAAAEPAAQPPGVAATIAVPPLEESQSEGGEWELLVERVSAWWNSGELNRQWQRIRGPLKGVAILVAVLLALQLYATVVRTVDGIPLVSGLLELTGLIAVLQFSVRRLLRSSDRQEVLAQLQRRWLDFRGRG